MGTTTDATPPTTVLKNEHRVIERVLRVLELLADRARRGPGLERESVERCIEFFTLFADACHHAKEENLLFPVLEARGIPNAGGPIGVMLEEHRLGRLYVRDMSDALAALDSDPEAEDRLLAAADRYLDLLRGHIFKEDNVLFEMGDRVLSADDRTALGSGFCDVACRSFDGRTREELVAIADQLDERWPAA